jgi:hypothetical protein
MRIVLAILVVLALLGVVVWLGTQQAGAPPDVTTSPPPDGTVVGAVPPPEPAPIPNPSVPREGSEPPRPRNPRSTADPRPEPSPFDPLKAFIARMQAAAGVLHAAPDRVEVGQQVDVTLTISPTSTEADLRERTRAEGAAVDVGTARIAPRMRAQLIVPEGATSAVVGSEERAVHDTDDTVWRWTVTPTRTGDLPLRAVLIAPVILDGKETPYDVRTFEARVTVFVTPTTRVRDFVAANWQWLWTALVVPVFLWWRKRRTGQAATVKSGDP